jgi:hypothetical protein
MNSKLLYSPKGIWSEYDFLINEHYWINKGIDRSYRIRVDNIIDVNLLLSKYRITNWIQGKTLKGIVIERKLLNDHDDDFGVFIKDKDLIRTLVLDDLYDMGFNLIRDTDNIISVERGYRYIDICLFRSLSDGKIGYSQKSFDENYFTNFEAIAWEGAVLSVPVNAEDLISEMYKSSLVKYVLSKLSGNLTEKLKRKVRYAFKYILSKCIEILSIVPDKLAVHFSRIITAIGGNIIELSEEQFMNTAIEPTESFNWRWRARHLNVVTNNGEAVLVKDIINYLSDDSVVNEIENNIEETDTKKVFYDPSNLDMRFWWGGNNYFWYCVKYQYRKNVVPYSKVNNYIKNYGTPYIYTDKYYESLQRMTGDEIRYFLLKTPIEIRDNAIVGGKHRVFAMIGRIISGKEYIPMSAILFDE